MNADAVAQTLSEARAWIEAAHRAGADPTPLLAHRTQAADAVVRSLYACALRDLGRPPKGTAVVAVGGYGRGELAPHSDLDLLVVHRGWGDEDLQALTRAVTYPLWDAGLEVGHRVRTPSEVLSMVSRTDEAIALLDLRPLAGDEVLLSDLSSAVHRQLQRSRARVIRGLREETADRHARNGHAGHLLEPDLREAEGGLRDAQTISWLGRLRWACGGIQDLETRGLLTGVDAVRSREAWTFLQRVRIELHLRSSRRNDRLLLQDQDDVGTSLGFGSSGAAAGDELMRTLYEHARLLGAVAQELWHREGSEGTRRRRWSRRPAGRSVGDGCVIHDGRLEVVAVADPSADADGWLRCFLHAASNDIPVGRVSLDRLRLALDGSSAVSWSPAAFQTFLRILQTGRPAIDVLESMDAAGLLPSLIPEWRHVRCLPQRNLYHRLTVDMHLFNTVSEIVASRSDASPDVDDAWSRVDDPTALLLAGLLHDIGKGQGDDHVVLGREMSMRAVARIGLDQVVVEDVGLLVGEHLALAEAAVRRNVQDPRVAEELGGRIGDGRRLAMLYLLTRADSLATGPEAWSPFRASLVRELYWRTLGTVADGREDASPLERAQWARASWETPPGEGEVRIEARSQGDLEDVVVVARDRPGLMAAVCGVLALRGINVMAADVRTLPDGTAVESYVVAGAHGPVPAHRWDRVRTDVDAALAGELDVERKLREKAAHAAGRVRPVREPRVVLDRNASEGHTVVEVHAPDRLGLLYRLARVLYDRGCDVHVARAATYGSEVVDVFYITGRDGGPLTDISELDELSRALAQAAAR